VTKPKARGRGRPRYDAEDAKAAAAFRKLGAKTILERDDMAPLWVQLRNRIEDAMNKGVLAANSRIPSEQAFCEIFGVSKPVVRAALGALSVDGRIIKMPRKGMFVAPPREHVDFMATNLGVFGDLTAKGHKVSTRTFELVRTKASEKERRIYGLPPEGDVVRIGRVYLSDNVPITMTHITLPGHRVPGFETRLAENKSVFQMLREVYGITLSRADRWLTAALPTPEQVERMGISAHTPLIAIESLAYDTDGMPLEYYEAVYNSSLARIHMAVGHSSGRPGSRSRALF
jgi:GntR family transcriptional regulator